MYIVYHFEIKESETEDQSAVRGLLKAEASTLPVAADVSVLNEVVIYPNINTF